MTAKMPPKVYLTPRLRGRGQRAQRAGPKIRFKPLVGRCLSCMPATVIRHRNILSKFQLFSPEILDGEVQMLSGCVSTLILRISQNQAKRTNNLSTEPRRLNCSRRREKRSYQSLRRQPLGCSYTPQYLPLQTLRREQKRHMDFLNRALLSGLSVAIIRKHGRSLTS